jgi:c-di-GMP-binding flagellar brake protein YcgR
MADNPAEGNRHSSINKLLCVHQSALLEVAEAKYTCRVHDFTEEIITLTAPLDDRGHPVRVTQGTPVRVVLQTNQGFLGFDTQSVGPKVVANLPLLDVSRPLQVERTDRREYYRVPVNLPLSYCPAGESHYQTGRITDISGGGLLCVLPRSFMVEHGMLLDICLTLSTSRDPIEVQVCVKKVFEAPPRSESHRVACEFVDIPQRMREIVIRFVAQRQLELIRAGVLQ